MHTNVILTTGNRRRTHGQSNYTNTKLKARFRRLLRPTPPDPHAGHFRDESFQAIIYSDTYNED